MRETDRCYQSTKQIQTDFITLNHENDAYMNLIIRKAK